ncbi:MAG: hypothetical protein A2X36_14375 [Elusimicrobia bacterium GWA2_69_24]|nr:MAG: hypothetical protein A2X36_14375 [Elusimicrobia bacterium GWA2_69_24]HBL18421.1 hypothetical protein [Elusimicrobiota bacterium]
MALTLLAATGAGWAAELPAPRPAGDHFAAMSWEEFSRDRGFSTGMQACPKLDLLCRPVRWGDAVEFKAAAPRFQENAITLRFGARTEPSPSKIEVQVGSFLKTALFVAALVAFIL